MSCSEFTFTFPRVVNSVRTPNAVSPSAVAVVYLSPHVTRAILSRHCTVQKLFPAVLDLFDAVLECRASILLRASTKRLRAAAQRWFRAAVANLPRVYTIEVAQARASSLLRIGGNIRHQIGWQCEQSLVKFRANLDICVCLLLLHLILKRSGLLC